MALRHDPPRAPVPRTGQPHDPRSARTCSNATHTMFLTLAGFLATNAIRCWPPECRIAVAEEWCATLMARLRESLD